MDTLGIRAHQGLADHALPELLLEHVLTDCVPVICGVAEVHVDEVITRVVPLGPCVWKGREGGWSWREGGCIDGGTYIGFTFLSPFMPAWMPQWDLSRVADIDSNDE
jgi:hypothetical protein